MGPEPSRGAPGAAMAPGLAATRVAAAMRVIGAMLAAAAISGCAGPAPAGPGAAPAGGAESPAAAWERAREAFRRGAFREYAEAISPAARDECLCFLVWVVSMEPRGGRLTSGGGLVEMNAILRRYGAAEIGQEPVDPSADRRPGFFSRRAIGRIEDKVGLFADMMGFFSGRGLAWGHGALPAWMRGDLDEVRPRGETATATVRGRGEVGFDRIGGRWFLRPRNVCLDDLFRGEAGR